jgi:hypothetical protein
MNSFLLWLAVYFAAPLLLTLLVQAAAIVLLRRWEARLPVARRGKSQLLSKKRRVTAHWSLRFLLLAGMLPLFIAAEEVGNLIPLGILMLTAVPGFAWGWRRLRSREVRWTFAIASLFCLGTFYFLLVPPVIRHTVGWAPATERRQLLNVIAQAFEEYRVEHDKRFPPPFVTDSNGKRIHSWRALILPYFKGKEESGRYYHADEPWDGPTNRRLAAKQYPGYGFDGYDLLAITGPGTAWQTPRGVRGSDIADDPTLLFVAVLDSGMNWMEPHDLEFNSDGVLVSTKTGQPVDCRVEDGWRIKKAAISGLFLSGQPNPFGRERSLPDDIDPAVLKALTTINGGEIITPESLQRTPRSQRAHDTKRLILDLKMTWRNRHYRSLKVWHYLLTGVMLVLWAEALWVWLPVTKGLRIHTKN